MTWAENYVLCKIRHNMQGEEKAAAQSLPDHGGELSIGSHVQVA